MLQHFPKGRSVRFHRSPRRGFTLLEVLVATTVTLLMMAALAKIFKDIGTSMKQGRATLELNNRLRDVTFRMRRDLQNLTCTPNPPAGDTTGMGYMQYYDGPQTDYTTTIYSTTLNSNANPLDDVPNTSRIGDVDDILMATVRAGDVWFTGKVPSFVLERRAPSAADNDGNGRIDDLENLISVGAQHAEVVVFMEPVVAGARTDFPGIDNSQRDQSYLVANTDFYQDNDGDSVPDAYRLYYRTLIIRPDLNSAGVLPSSGAIFTAGPVSGTLPNGTPFSLPSPLCDMSRIHGACDLSIRRVYDGDSTTRDQVAANSLEDLVDPANRFAHVQIDLGNSTTMPLLALGPGPAMLASFNPTGVGSGFLHPAFTLQGERTGEDILASDLLAFDVKAFDPGCTLLASFGSDGAPGVAAIDDDGNGVQDFNGSTPDLNEAGWAGSDDLVLSPNDPGYATAMATGAVTVGSGEYVDLGWAHKLVTHGASLTAAMPLWSQLSGYSQNNFMAAPSGFPFTDALYKSGMAIQNRAFNASQPPLVLQTSYDTWTKRYEEDGILQGSRPPLTGNVRINGNLQLYGNGANETGQVLPAWRRANIDAARDGIDNNGIDSSGNIDPNRIGVDDVSEFETSPPFPVALRGLKISIRMEDPGTRTVRQMSIAQEFVSQ
ncbi:MAG: prepilin-type N-terminal cleavage/methylation domain-containing protein [Planctomycetales bacterium]|nr:prepilin-type N-terminal cleavage/methylation domain-containing protein [Planctomycetales bacterium]